MAVMDEFKEEREALKHGTPKQKFTYFLDYYKWYVIIALLVIVAGTYTIYEIVTKKDTAFYVCLLNTLELDAAEYNAGFIESTGIDTNEYQLIFDTDTWIDINSMDESTMANSQKLMAHLAAGELDVMITDSNSITNYTYQEDFYTMEELLSPEQYERYKPYFYYVDMVTLAEWHEYISNPDNLMLEIDFDFPDPRKPEEMESPVAVGIFLDESEALRNCYHFRSDDVVFSVFLNSSHIETALQYLEYLTQ
jgi:hypothetical protein